MLMNPRFSKGLAPIKRVALLWFFQFTTINHVDRQAMAGISFSDNSFVPLPFADDLLSTTFENFNERIANAPTFPAGTSAGTVGANGTNFFGFAGPNPVNGAGTTTGLGGTGVTPTGIVPPGTPASGTAANTGNFFNFQQPNVGATMGASSPVVNGGVQTATTGGNTFGFQQPIVPSITQPTIPIGVPNANLTPAFQGPGPIATVNGIPSTVSMGGGNMVNVGNGIAGGSVLQPVGGTGGVAFPATSNGVLGGLANAGGAQAVTGLSRADGLDLAALDADDSFVDDDFATI
jgi:hypothetical protein